MSSSSTPPPSLQTLSLRLSSITSLLLERSRVIQLNLPPSASTDSQIIRLLTFIRDGLSKQGELMNLESSGLKLGGDDRRESGGGGGRLKTGSRGRAMGPNVKELEELEARYDRAIESMSQDEIGKMKVKGLHRVERRIQSPPPLSSPPPILNPTMSSTDPLSQDPFTIDSPPSSPQASRSSSPSTIKPFRDHPSRSRSRPRSHSRSPNRFNDDDEQHQSPFSDPLNSVSGDENGYTKGRNKRRLFDEERGRSGGYDEEEEGEEQTDQQVMENRRQMMNDQDQRLSALSTSITRQTQLSMQIGSELDIHHELLDDTDHRMDMTGERLRGARGRLDRLAKGAKNWGSTITIIILILILLILIIAFKT